MKLLLMSLACVLGVSLCTARSPQDGIPSAKECKRMSRHLEKEGWEVYPNGQSLESALSSLYARQQQEQAHCIVGNGEAPNVNSALRKAVTNATVQYATMKDSRVQGRAVSKMENAVTEETINGSETFSSSYANSVDQRVKSLKPVLTLRRQLANKKTEVMVYCLVKQIP